MYFHENFEEIFSEFWRNSLKIRGEKWEHCEKFKNEKQKLLTCTHSLIGNRWKKIQKIIIKKKSKKAIKIDNCKFLNDNQ